jgi:hypothetical protein
MTNSPDDLGAGLTDEQQTTKDRSYSPGSETETAAKQSDHVSETVDHDIDRDDITVAPGTGGPDDVGDVEVDPDDLNMPHDTGAH